MAVQLARSPTPLHVMIIGGGLGGLCLAQGLKQAGVSVAVYERDRSRVSRTEGFRIHINPAGSRALYECLPPILWRAFLAIAGKTGGGFTFLTERLRPLVTIDEDLMTGGGRGPVERQYPIDRTALRQLLSAGLDDIVHFDKPFERYERLPDGRVEACFADGFTAAGDVLVGADGANSRVRQQYLPQAHRVE